jgi:DNA repair protein RadC
MSPGRQPDLFSPNGGLDETSPTLILPAAGRAPWSAPVPAGDLERLTDLEALSLLLARAGVPVSKAAILLQRYGCLRRCLAAEQPGLAAIAGDGAALDLRLIHEIARRLAEAQVSGRSVLSAWSAVVAYLKLTMAHLDREAFRVLFLDKRNQLIADEILGQGTVDHAPVYPREVLRRALELSSSAMIIVHNHPSGDPTPSAADIDMTRQIVAAAKVFAIAVHDHVIVGRVDIASFRALGLM